MLDVVSLADAIGFHSSKPNYLPGVILRYALLALGICLIPVVITRIPRALSGTVTGAREQVAASLQPLTAEAKAKQVRKLTAGIVVAVVCGIILVIMFAYAIMQGLHH